MNAPAIRYVSPEEMGFEKQTLDTPRFVFPSRITPQHNWSTAVALWGAGTCLEPWLRADDAVWYTPNITPRDGDLVAVDIEMKFMSEDTGERCWLTCVKQYRIVHGWVPQLTCNDEAIVLDPSKNKILGVITAWRRKQWWKRPSLKGMTFPIITDCLLMAPQRTPGRL